MSDVTPVLKNLVDCPCSCGAYGVPRGANGHPKGCSGRCCQGRRNRISGMKAQGRARRRLGVPKARLSSKLGNEENWRHPLFRFEVKSGAQVRPILTRFLAAEAQAEQARAVGDIRPLVMAAMPDGMVGEGLVVLRLSTWERDIVPFLEGDPEPASTAVRDVVKVPPRPPLYDQAREGDR